MRQVRNTIDAPFYGAKATALQSELDLSVDQKTRSRGPYFTLERIRFELNHDRALSFCFDAFSSNAFSSEACPRVKPEGMLLLNSLP
jgi:hypothetical protein